MRSLKVGSGKSVHINDEGYDFLSPLCGGWITLYGLAFRVVSEAPTCRSCLNKAEREAEEAEEERDEIARTLPDGDLAYWIANPKTGADAEPEQHAAFVAEKARRDQEAYERNQEADRKYGPLSVAKPIYPVSQ